MIKLTLGCCRYPLNMLLFIAVLTPIVPSFLCHAPYEVAGVASVPIAVVAIATEVSTEAIVSLNNGVDWLFPGEVGVGG